MQQSLAACALGDPAWDPCHPCCPPKGTNWCPQKGEGGVSGRRSSSVGAVPKKVAWDTGDTRDAHLQLVQKLCLNRMAGKT